MPTKPRKKSGAQEAPKEKKSDATRARILDAANRVLGKKGYSATRLADIAKAAKTQAGAMYYYFESKEALVEELMHRNAVRSMQVTEQAVAALPPDASYRDRLLTVARCALSNVVGEKGDEIVVYMRLLNQVPSEIRTRMLGHAIESRQFVKSLIREGQAAGEFRSDINPTIAALMLLSNLIWSHDWFHLSAHHSLDELAQEMCHILLAGMESPSDPIVKPARKSARASARHAAGRGRRPAVAEG